MIARWQARRAWTSRPFPRSILLFWSLIGLMAGACGGRPAAEDLHVDWSLSPAPPIVGLPAMLEITLRDRDCVPIAGAHLEIEGHMSHPGMAPVLAPMEERGGGAYRARVALPMAGDWIVVLKGTLPDGRPVNHRIDIANVQPSG